MSPVHVRLREWQTLGPESSALRGRDLGSQPARDLARRLTVSDVIDVTELRDGVHVQARAHVGRIQLGDILITIEPKIGTFELLALLRYAYGLRNLRLFEQTRFAHTGELLQDLLAAQLLAEVTELVSRGLSRRYVQRTEDLASPRGKIQFGALARRANVATTLLCQHHQRSADHLLNGVIRAGVELAANIAQERGLRRSLFRLDAQMGMEVGAVPLSVDSLTRAKLGVNRLTVAYAPALHLTELLYACAAVSLDGESTTTLPGFLFDMNRFFQTLIGRFLADHLSGYEVEEEHRLTDMMRYLPGFNPNRRKSPTPRPDFVVKRGASVIRLLDAKYRDLWERELPRDMLYQLAIYALSQPRPATATILFPTVNVEATPAVVEIRDPVHPTALGYVELRPVALGALVDVLRQGPAAERERVARTLAFGRTPPRGATNPPPSVVM